MSTNLPFKAASEVSYPQNVSLGAKPTHKVSQISKSLVTQNRNRNLIGNSLNRPFVVPIDSMSVGLN